MAVIPLYPIGKGPYNGRRRILYKTLGAQSGFCIVTVNVDKVIYSVPYKDYWQANKKATTLQSLGYNVWLEELS